MAISRNSERKSELNRTDIGLSDFIGRYSRAGCNNGKTSASTRPQLRSKHAVGQLSISKTQELVHENSCTYTVATLGQDMVMAFVVMFVFGAMVLTGVDKVLET